MSKKLVLLDGHAIIHRAYHAIRPLTTPAGELVNAVFGFTSMLLNVWEVERPDYLAIAFDLKGPTFRHQADANYKATRAKSPDELNRQIKRVYELVRAFEIPEFAMSGFEADDMIATIVQQVARQPDLHTIIVSGDRDLLQLVSERVSVHDLTKGYRESINFTPEEVKKKYGFAPTLIPDYKGLAGDASDNLPGVAGIGPKTATELLNQFGSLEGIYAHLDQIRESLRAKLVAEREQAYHSKKMATLHSTAPIEFVLESCAAQEFDREAVWTLLEELNFRSLQARFKKIFPVSTEKIGDDEAKTAEQQSLF